MTDEKIEESEPLGFLLTFKGDIEVGVWFDFKGDISSIFAGDSTKEDAQALFIQGVADVVRKALRNDS